MVAQKTLLCNIHALHRLSSLVGYSANTNLLSAPRVSTTLPPVVLLLQPPQSGTHYRLAFVTLPLPIPFVAFIKLTASSRPSASPHSDSPKCLRFGHWLTLCTLNIHLLTYLLTYLGQKRPTSINAVMLKNQTQCGPHFTASDLCF